MAREWAWNGVRFVTEVEPRIDETAVAYHARVMTHPSTFRTQGLNLPVNLQCWDLWDVYPELNKDGADDVVVYGHLLDPGWEILVVGGEPILRHSDEEEKPLPPDAPRTYAQIRALYEKVKAGAGG